MQWIYLDNNATTQPAPEVVQAMQEMLDTQWANPSSVHRFGQQARQRVELARHSVARLLHTADRYITFTSGGTESNNLALRGYFDGAEYGVLITTPIEHSAIREPAMALQRAGITLEQLPVDADGVVSPEDLHKVLSRRAPHAGSTLVSIQWANNETGVLQPVEALVNVIQRVREENRAAGLNQAVVLHTDATQAVGKFPVDVEAVAVDMLTCSAHKFHGPKGAGVFYARRGLRVHTQNIGGPQERERRGGTENTPAIVGMGVAADLAEQFLADTARIQALEQLRQRFEQGVCRLLPTTVINSSGAARLWNTSNLGFPHLEAEAILLSLSERGVCASAGAACSSGSLEPSPVLLAMGIAPVVAHGSVRFSISRYTTQAEVDQAVEAVAAVVKHLGKTLPLGNTGV